MPRYSAQHGQDVLVAVPRGETAQWRRRLGSSSMILAADRVPGGSIVREATRIEQLMMRLDGLRRCVKYDPRFYRRKLASEISELEKEIRGLMRDERRAAAGGGKGGPVR